MVCLDDNGRFTQQSVDQYKKEGRASGRKLIQVTTYLLKVVLKTYVSHCFYRKFKSWAWIKISVTAIDMFEVLSSNALEYQTQKHDSISVF